MHMCGCVKYFLKRPCSSNNKLDEKLLEGLFHNTSLIEMSYVRSINNVAKFDAFVKFHDKGTSKSLTKYAADEEDSSCSLMR